MTRQIFEFGAWCFAATLIAFAASFASWSAPWLGTLGFVALVGGSACAYRRSFRLGTAIVLVELVAGSVGHAFTLHAGPEIPVRMGLFVVAFAATALRLIRSRDDRGYCLRWGMPWASGLLALAVVWGIVRGILAHPLAAVVEDANAYAFFALLPTMLLALREREDRDRLLAAIFGAATANAILVLLVLVLFTQPVPEGVTWLVNKWIRDFRFGEITGSPGGFARVFLQSAFWNAVVALWCLPLLARAGKDRHGRWLWAVGGLTAAVVFVSFSRTFWVAVIIAVIAGAVVTARQAHPIRAIGSYARVAIILAVVGIGVALALTRSVGTAAVSRAGSFASGAAVDSRKNLLAAMLPAIGERPSLGSGFGTALTYRTEDPRLLAYFPDGNYTTTAFEWGWLDLWLKTGILGPLAFAVFLGALLVHAWNLGRDEPLAVALVAGLVFVAVAHLFSPWLNHPLGIGLLLVTLGLLAGLKEKKTTLG